MVFFEAWSPQKQATEAGWSSDKDRFNLLSQSNLLALKKKAKYLTARDSDQTYQYSYYRNYKFMMVAKAI